MWTKSGAEQYRIANKTEEAGYWIRADYEYFKREQINKKQSALF